MEKQLFAIAVSAAKRESMAGYNDKAMDYLKSALGYANTMNDRRARSMTMQAMNAIRAAEKRKSATPYLDRAREITRNERAVTKGNNALYSIVLGFGLMSACAAGLGIGYLVNMPRDTSAYELVRLEAGNAYVDDFNLSASDCINAAASLTADGLSVRCELSR